MLLFQSWNPIEHGLETRNYEWTKVGHCSKAVFFLEKKHW